MGIVGNRPRALLPKKCRDTRLMQKRGKDMSKMRDALTLLIEARPLPPRLKDHPLSGEWRGWRDLHIEPDWLLIYKILPSRFAW